MSHDNLEFKKAPQVNLDTWAGVIKGSKIVTAFVVVTLLLMAAGLT